jgi:SAM-dependent methyltransferase
LDLEILKPDDSPATPFNVEAAVRERYSAALRQPAKDLCCPSPQNNEFLSAIPREILDRDFGCGDPSRHVREGETVLDLGSGAGKVCYVAAQVVGPRGRVIGVDANADMLALARKHQRQIGDRLGFHNVEFRKGRIQDLALDLESLGDYLRQHPAADAISWQKAQEHAALLRKTHPMIADDSIDVVISNCVLNLVAKEDRRALFAEIFRVLKPGGRAVISDVTCDEPVPLRLQNDADLWSGCLGGAFLESEFLAAFAAAGFHGIRILDRQPDPWQTIEGIEFRSMTVEAFKGDTCEPVTGRDFHQALLYRGPWKTVADDRGNVLVRGERMAVSDADFSRLTKAPYSDQLIAVPPRQPVDPASARPFACTGEVRDPRQTKGAVDRQSRSFGPCCGGSCDG